MRKEYGSTQQRNTPTNSCGRFHIEHFNFHHTTDYGQVLFLHRPRQNNSVIILSYGSKFNANPAALPAQKECAASADPCRRLFHPPCQECTTHPQNVQKCLTHSSNRPKSAFILLEAEKSYSTHAGWATF